MYMYMYMHMYRHGVAMISRLLQNVGLFCRTFIGLFCKRDLCF